LKLIVDEELAKKFERAVLAKRGRVELSREGAEALKFYLEKNKQLLETPRTHRTDPMVQVIGAVKTTGRRNALADLKLLELTGNFVPKNIRAKSIPNR